MNDYLKLFAPNPDANQIIIMLPDIWSQTPYSADTAAQFAQKFSMPVYMLDYFYQLTGKANIFDPSTDQDIAPELMAKMTGEDFINIFNKALEDIKSNQPKLESITVIGFCFGGRLAYLSGLSSEVKKIVAFYGAGAHIANYYEGKTPIEALCEIRRNDQSLSVLSFYGSRDGSIPESDRQTTSQAFKDAGIDYAEKIYDAGHAYFQPGRAEMYNEAAASASWVDLENFIKA
jgi:carboxymethylenebutenolidase